MKTLSELFYRCAFTAPYIEAGDDVDYCFDEEGDHLYIYFQGSHSISDWFRNFFFFPIGKRPYKDMDLKYKVHRGFLAAWKEVEDIVVNKILEQTEDGKHLKWKHITVVGYSHGGALAMLCHECVWFYRPDLRAEGLVGYGFEAPKVLSCWHEPKDLKERWEKFSVIRNGSDLVTHMPPWLFRFCHVGNMIKINGDVSLVTEKVPTCIKYHFPQCVLDGLNKKES